MPTLTQLEYILAVHQLKHFGRAANECHVSQPSLSAQIQKVESELEITIFDRSKKPILTTKQGLRLVEQAKKVLAEHKKIFEISHDSKQISGPFHLAVIPTLSNDIIPLFVEVFSKKYPEVQLKISENKTEDIIKLLMADEIDAGLLVTPLEDVRIEEIPLFLEPFFAFVSSSHELCKRKTLKESDLEENSIWLLDEGHCFRNQVMRVCDMKNRNGVLKNVSFESGSLETLKNLIRKGSGYTLLPYLSTLNLPLTEKEKNLKKLTRPIPSREVSLVHGKTAFKTAIISALKDEIIASLPEELKGFKKNHLEVIDI